MPLTTYLDWIAVNIPQLLLSEPFSGLMGLLIATYIINFIFRR